MRIPIRLLVAMLLLALPGAASAQGGTGRITGRVVDAATGRPVVGARVGLAGSSIGAVSGADGRYEMEGVPVGTVSLRATAIGYLETTLTGVAVVAGTATLDISLPASPLELGGITVRGTAEQGSVGRALDEQRTAVGVVNSTSSEQMARSPDRDAAQAAQRVSGVTVREGRYVFVRGLGERYTTAALNGARLPSPEPEKKVVPLDIFPSNLLESITISKTFTPDQPGDFSGAAVNLRTKSFPSERVVQYAIGVGLSQGAVESTVPRGPSAGREWLGMGVDERQMPDRLAGVADFASLSQAEVNEIIRSFRGVWLPSAGRGTPNGSASLSVGGEDPIFGQRIGYVASATYSRGQEVRTNEVRARAIPGDAAGTPVQIDRFKGSTGQVSTLWGGLLNLSAHLGDHTRVELTHTYDRSADNEAHVDVGGLEEFPALSDVRRTSLRYVERGVRSDQLRGEHGLGDRQRLTWSLTWSGVTRDEPDRSDIVHGREPGSSTLAWLGDLNEGAKRSYATLDETALEGSAGYAIDVGAGRIPATLEFGGSYRAVRRDAASSSYNLRSLTLGVEDRARDPGDIFGADYTIGSEARILLEPNPTGGSYTADDEVAAGYLIARIEAAPWLSLVAGARAERWNLDMQSEPTTGGLIATTRQVTDVLPALALNFALSDVQKVRISLSRTLARPEYRELAPISYREMVGDREVVGDSTLVRTLVRNVDVRWEYYPASGEVLSLGVFVKRFSRPIEAIDVATTGANRLSYANAAGADNYGLELEARRQLGFLHQALDAFAVFANATVMRSTIRTGNLTASALTHAERPMVGQAPYVLNAGVTYTDGGTGDLSATLLYNLVGRRMVAAAVRPLNADSYEMPRHDLDFSLRLPLHAGVSARIDLTNLLGSAHEELQGDVVRYRYELGRVLSVGISWRQ